MNRLFYILIISILLSSCNKESNYPHEEGLRDYMTRVHNLDIQELERNILYITPVDGCNYCVKQNLYNLIRTENDQVIPVLINYTTDYEVEDLIKLVKEKYSVVLTDRDSKIFTYKTGYLKPIVLEIIKGEINKYYYVEDDKIQEVENFLSRSK